MSSCNGIGDLDVPVVVMSAEGSEIAQAGFSNSMVAFVFCLNLLFHAMAT
jgi:hypothetical protein